MSPVLRVFVDCALILVALGLAGIVLLADPVDEGLLVEVTRAMQSSGVGHPVTAVLLNFRAYDTLLEMLVLLLALIGVRSLKSLPPVSPDASASPVLQYLLRVLAPLLILIAAYLLWKGSAGPGGAFQAGSVLGGAGILYLLVGGSGFPKPASRSMWECMLECMSVFGVGMFATVGMYLAITHGAFLAYPPAVAGTLIFVLELFASVSIAVTLTVLFMGAHRRDT